MWKALDLHSKIFGLIWKCPIIWDIKQQCFKTVTAKKELVIWKYVLTTIFFYSLIPLFQLLNLIFKSEDSGPTDPRTGLRTFVLLGAIFFALSFALATVHYGHETVVGCTDLQIQEKQLRKGI